MTDLDDDTLEHVFNQLRGNHPEAALKVADLLLQESPSDWAERKAPEFNDRVALVKALRSQYDMKLKEANKVAKSIWDGDGRDEQSKL